MKAYLFVSAAADATGLAAALRELPGVVAADATTGAVDVIAVCETAGLAALNRVIWAVQEREDVIKSTVRVVIGPRARAARHSIAAA